MRRLRRYRRKRQANLFEDDIPQVCGTCATPLPGAKPGAVCADRTISGLSPSWCLRSARLAGTERRRNPQQASLFEDRGHVRLSVEPDFDSYEWVVKYYLNDRYKEGPTYYASDFEDAVISAQAMKREAENRGYAVTIVIIDRDQFKSSEEECPHGRWVDMCFECDPEDDD